MNPILSPLSDITLTEGIIIALVGAGSGLIGSLILSGVQLVKWGSGEQRKIQAEADKAELEGNKALSESTIVLLGPLNADLKTIREENAIIKQENADLKNKFIASDVLWNTKFETFRTSESDSYKRKERELLKKIEISENSWEEKLAVLNATWDEKFNSLRIEYTEIQKELVIFKNWAERLVHQVYSLGGEPVPMIVDTRDKDESK